MMRPDVEKILSPLKDFQRASVEHVFRRMYLDGDKATTRFLLADEVGLGKTLVAKGVIARVIDHLWDAVDRIDIIYICSNAEIARQNINRLHLGGDLAFTQATRITMLPVQLRDMRTRKLNFVSITPSTSFSMASQTGYSTERILLYHLLREPWELEGMGPVNMLMADVTKVQQWRAAIDRFEDEHVIDEDLRKRFAREIRRREHRELRAAFDELCGSFRTHRHTADADERREQRRVIGALRDIVARTCLAALEPDFIIMDEFQRFRHLLDMREENEENRIARDLFTYSDASTTARVLLVSATPYKMYTLAGEREGDHYEDFLYTFGFLAGDARRDALKALLDRYRRQLVHVHETGVAALAATKNELECELRRFIVRTERLAVGDDRDGMLRTVAPRGLALASGDLGHFALMDGVARVVEGTADIDYWKSAPYLLNFMDGYDVKQRVVKAVAAGTHAEDLAALVGRHAGCVLQQREIDAYAALDAGNARLRALIADVVDRGMWRLLWMPPSHAYYAPAGVFAAEGVAGFTKRLVFSAWQVVPKVIAVMLSYEAERRMAGMQEGGLRNTADERRKRRGLLRFAVKAGRESGMPALALTYPSTFLAAACDPLDLMAEASAAPTLAEMLHLAGARILSALGSANDVASMPLKGGWTSSSTHQSERPSETSAPLTALIDPTRGEDESWYWAAPLLLDLRMGTEVDAWLAHPDLAARWSGREDPSLDDDDEWRWADHVERLAATARSYRDGTLRLGAMPDDLAEVLALQALAAPATVALRAFGRVVGSALVVEAPVASDGSGGATGAVADRDAGQESLPLALRSAAGRVGWSFLTLFNLPESMSLLRGLGGAEPYWRRVLEYGAEGNLQAVLDEYVHVLVDMIGLRGRGAVDAVGQLAAEVCDVVALRTARVAVDDVRRPMREGRFVHLEQFGRVRFALRLQKEKSDAGDGETRADTVRKAFNSPFWPFVLASTSVGQEGLDFHAYCHAVVHWNLPSNPVDMEQREGRVHRFKGHAIRRNVALRHGDGGRDGHADVWEAMFTRAAAGRGADAGDMVPYWVYAVEGGASIERHVPALPLSADEQRLVAMRRSLAVYRMVFGQSRQQDLVAYLSSHLTADQIADVTSALRIDLSP
jgi:uncharacterized membrane protein